VEEVDGLPAAADAFDFVQDPFALRRAVQRDENTTHRVLLPQDSPTFLRCGVRASVMARWRRIRPQDFLEGTLIPFRRALDRPIAMACFRFFTGCFPSRAWWISSRTYSPARVDGERRRLLLRRRDPFLVVAMHLSFEDEGWGVLYCP
jgi:hypothetical protein